MLRDGPADKPRLVLGSASPRRLNLLQQTGLEPDLVAPADINEDPLPQELPRVYAARMAGEKAEKLAGLHAGNFILTADTVVAAGRRILPKTEDKDTAYACLKRLSGRRHRVLGGICLIAPNGKRTVRISVTGVTVKRLSPSETDAYLESGEWDGKAGGYAIQGMFARFIPRISGSYTNVVGLDAALAANLLTGQGFCPASGPGIG